MGYPVYYYNIARPQMDGRRPCNDMHINAATLLERHAVPLPAAAAVSLTRFDNTGPWPLLGRMMTGWRHQSSNSISLLVALLVLTTLSLQFTSTALVSQVGLGSLLVPTSIPQTFYGVNSTGPSYEADKSTPWYVDMTPAGFPAFAEWVSNAIASHTAT